MTGKNSAPASAVVFLDKRADEPFTTSDVIAECTGVKHHAIQELILKQKTRLENFGQVAFEMRAVHYKRGTNMEKVYHLNEQQATLLITFMKNTEVVADFKVELVRQFYAMRALIMERQSDAWRQAREDGKAVRRAETDAIKAFVAYAAEHGSKHPAMYYKHFTVLAYKTVGIEGGARDTVTGSALLDLRLAEQIIGRAVSSELAKGTEYHAAFQNVKDRLQQVGALAFPDESKVVKKGIKGH